MVEKVFEAILSRRSIRRYTSKPVSEMNIKKMLEAAMAAPSASNLKPWHFIVVTERSLLDKLAQAHPYGKMLFEAPLCIAVCGDTSVSENFWVQDCSASTEKPASSRLLIRSRRRLARRISATRPNKEHKKSAAASRNRYPS
jgi:nitroreductase